MTPTRVWDDYSELAHMSPPRYWVIRQDSPNVLSKKSNEIVLRSRQSIRIKESDRCIISTHTGDRDIVFSQQGSCAEVIHKSESDYDTYVIRFSRLESFEKSFLRDLTFSLTKIRNLDNPHRHFARTYTSISKYDFDTIVLGRVFIARTAYLLFLRSMPERLRIQFEWDESLAGRSRPYLAYSTRWNLLQSFLADHVFYIGNLTSSITSNWAVIEDEIDLGSSMVEFGHTEDSSDSLWNITRLFDDVWTSLGNSELLSGASSWLESPLLQEVNIALASDSQLECEEEFRWLHR